MRCVVLWRPVIARRQWELIEKKEMQGLAGTGPIPFSLPTPMSSPAQTGHPPLSSTSEADTDADAGDGHQQLLDPARARGPDGRDGSSLSLLTSTSASTSSSRSPTPLYVPTGTASKTVTMPPTLGQGTPPADAPLTQSQATSKSHFSAAGHLNHPHPNANANASQQPWLLRPIARAPSAESLRFSPGAAAAASSRSPSATAAAFAQPEAYQHPHFPSPLSSSSSLKNQLPNQSPMIPTRVPTSPHPTQQLRKQQSAYTLGSVEAGRGHGHYNYSAQRTPPLQELPFLQTQIVSNSRKTSAGAPVPSTATLTASPSSTSPQHSLLSAPSSPSDGKVLPPLPSSARASYHPPHAHGPRKTVSHSNMRFTHKRARPATTEGVISPAGMSENGDLGVGTGSGTRQKERGRRAAVGERESGREDVTPWDFQSTSEPASTNTSTRASSVAQSLRSRASSGVGATGPVADVTPWEVHEFVEGELGGKGEGREGGKDARGREKAREVELAIEEEDREYGVSRPMEFALGRARVSNVNTTNAGFVATSNGTGATSPTSASIKSAALSVRSRASSSAIGTGATGPVEEVTPWEVQAPDGNARTRSGGAGAPSVRSRASSAAPAMGTGGTGPVEEVTPWEVQVPAHAPSVRSRGSSMALGGISPGATGPIEEVTPWEVQTLAEEQERERASGEFAAATAISKPTTKKLNTNTKARQTKERSDSHSTTRSMALSPVAPSMRTTPSVRSRASSAALGTSGYTLAGAGGSVATGPVEEVTPWEVQVPTDGSRESEREGGRSRTSLNAIPAASYGVSRALAVDAAPFAPAPSPTTPGAQSVRSNGTGGGTGAVEEVTPWEVQAGPGETVYGVTREVRVLMEREGSRSVLSFHSASGTGGYGKTPTTAATTMTNGTGHNNSNTSSNSKAPSVRSGRSRASSAMHSPGGFGTTSTGSVEEVTPWEMYPAPPVLHAPPLPLPPPPGSSSSARLSQQGDRTAKIKGGRRWGRKSSAPSDGHTGAGASNEGGSGANTPMPSAAVPGMTATTSTSSHGAGYARSVKSTHTSTGPVEDVTPWEMQELPASPPLVSGPVMQRAATVESSFSYLANADINGQVAVSPNSISSHATPTSSSSTPVRPLIPTGLAEEVTPWETAAELPVQRISANNDIERAPLGVSVPVPVPGEEGVTETGDIQELEFLDEIPGEGSTPNTAMFTSSSGHYNGSAHGPLSAVSHASYASNALSYVSGTSTTTGAGAARGSMTLEQLAEVMPWELHPVPTQVGAAKSDVEKMAKERKGMRTQESQAHARQSTSGAGAGGGVAQALVEFGLRRRRSTGASGAEAVAMASGNASAIEGGGTAARGTKKSSKLSRLSTSGVAGGVSSSDMIPPADAAAYPGPHPESAAAAASTSKLKQKAKTDQDAANDRFSTADRTILEELKAGIRAREAQFKLKGVGHTVLGGGRGSGKKYHVYPKDIVPYPRSYERDVIDLDVWDTLFLMNISDSLSWHVFDTPPTNVLEIGCGTGTWILHCARTWKECHFVGLDIVSLHPDLQNVGSPDLASRITWVQHNFLEGLPFQNEEFDFVHIKRIALGVPEDKWDSFFEEVARVMKPGGRLEIIEEDLFFPGKKIDDEDENPIIFVRDDVSSATPRDSTRRDSTSSDKRRTSFSTNVHDGDRETVRLENVSEHSESYAPLTPKSRNMPLLSGMGLSRPGSPSRGGSSLSGHPSVSHDTHNNLKLSGGGRHHHHSQLVFAPGLSPSVSSSSSQPHDGLVTPHSRSTNRPSLHPPKLKDPYADLMYGSSSISLLGSMGYLAYHDPLTEAMKKHRKQEAAAKKNNAPMQGSQKTRPSAFLTTLMAKGPVNPRDHTILGAIWEGMLEGRFVNAAPNSLLQTYLEYHFTGVRTHPPLIYTFPPTPPKDEESDDEDEPNANLHVSGPSESDTDDARDAVIPRSKPKPRSTKSGKSANSNSSIGEGKEEKYLSRDSLVARQSPFVSFDGARSYAFSPSKKALFQAKTGQAATATDKDATIPHIVARMPNTTLHIDLNTLNMQLTLRAKEIIACSESMWEWVEELQAGPAGDEVLNGLAAPWDTAGVDVLADKDVTRNIILDMTRDDFDRLLCNFEWDMLDKACMGHALAERFNWHTFEGALLVDRKAYNKACKDYDKWLKQEHKLKSAADASRYSQHRSPNSTPAPGVVLPPSDVSTLSHDISEMTSSTSDPEASTLAPTPSIRMSVDDGSSIVTLSAPSGGRLLPETASNNGFGVVESASMVSNAPSQVLPQHMLSRALRVFVAWKAV